MSRWENKLNTASVKYSKVKAGSQHYRVSINNARLARNEDKKQWKRLNRDVRIAERRVKELRASIDASKKAKKEALQRLADVQKGMETAEAAYKLDCRRLQHLISVKSNDEMLLENTNNSNQNDYTIDFGIGSMGTSDFGGESTGRVRVGAKTNRTKGGGDGKHGYSGRRGVKARTESRRKQGGGMGGGSKKVNAKDLVMQSLGNMLSGGSIGNVVTKFSLGMLTINQEERIASNIQKNRWLLAGTGAQLHSQEQKVQSYETAFQTLTERTGFSDVVRLNLSLSLSLPLSLYINHICVCVSSEASHSIFLCPFPSLFLLRCSLIYLFTSLSISSTIPLNPLNPQYVPLRN